jgi:small subunit ribosomal protein S7
MRRAPAEVQRLEPDPVFRSVLVKQIINKILWKGKKDKARDIVYALLRSSESAGRSITVLKKRSTTFAPVKLRSRRVGGSAYQVPWCPRSNTLAIRWIMDLPASCERTRQNASPANPRARAPGTAFSARKRHKMIKSTRHSPTA